MVSGKQLPWETILILQVHFLFPSVDQSGFKPDGSISQKMTRVIIPISPVGRVFQFISQFIHMRILIAVHPKSDWVSVLQVLRKNGADHLPRGLSNAKT